MKKISGPEAGFSGLSGLFWTIAAFSSVVNLLMLTSPLYMLQASWPALVCAMHRRPRR